MPVILLPFITAVPPLVIAVLALIDGGLLYQLLTRAVLWSSKLVLMAGLVAVAVLAVVISQWSAKTPPILGADGLSLPGSIASLEQVEINGEKQWITIRGHDTDKPVLLFLAGGPGGTQLAATRKVLGQLEEHFVVVNWDQPGAGKSYRAADLKKLTPQQYLDDAHRLTLYLMERFEEEKIYVVGESWGSILGIWMVQQHPEHFHAFVGLA